MREAKIPARTERITTLLGSGVRIKFFQGFCGELFGGRANERRNWRSSGHAKREVMQGLEPSQLKVVEKIFDITRV